MSWFPPKFLLTFLGACAALVGCKGPGQPLEWPRRLPLATLAEGTTSGVRDARELLIRDAESWLLLWTEHARLGLPPEPAPEIDFSTHMVVALFGGECPSSGYEIHALDCCEDDAGVTLRGEHVEPMPGSMQAQYMTTPFSMYTVPIAAGEFRVEHGVPVAR